MFIGSAPGAPAVVEGLESMAKWSDDQGNGPGLVVPAGGRRAPGAVEKVCGVLRGTGVRSGLLVVAGFAVTGPVRKVEL